MASIAAIRDAIQVRLDTVSGLNAYDVATGGGERMPCAIVFPAGVERNAAASTEYTYQFIVEVWVPLAGGLRHAQDILDGLIDPLSATSIETAIEDDGTLGGIVDSTRVDGFESYGFGSFNAEPAAANALTTRIPVEVIG